MRIARKWPPCHAGPSISPPCCWRGRCTLATTAACPCSFCGRRWMCSPSSFWAAACICGCARARHEARHELTRKPRTRSPRVSRAAQSPCSVLAAVELTNMGLYIPQNGVIPLKPRTTLPLGMPVKKAIPGTNEYKYHLIRLLTSSCSKSRGAS